MQGVFDWTFFVHEAPYGEYFELKFIIQASQVKDWQCFRRPINALVKRTIVII